MMRAFSIIAIIASLVLIIGTVGFIHEVSCDRSAASYEMISSYSTDSSGEDSSEYDRYESEAADATRVGAIFSIIVLAFLNTTYFLSLLKIKTKTMKVISIIGLSLGGILMLFSFMPMSSPRNCSFDEVGAFYAIFGIVSLTFSIIGTIHSFRKKV